MRGYLRRFQWPPLSGPMRTTYPFSLRISMSLAMVRLETPAFCAKEEVVSVTSSVSLNGINFTIRRCLSVNSSVTLSVTLSVSPLSRGVSGLANRMVR